MTNMIKMKSEIIRFWLTHHYLRKIGKRYPGFLLDLIKEVTDNYNEARVMNDIYIKNKKFEVIAIDMGIDVRTVFRLHRQVIDKLINI